jgi:hypothetical protein
MKQSFSVHRIAHLIWRDLVLLKQSLLTALAASGIILFMTALYGLRGDYSLSNTEFMPIFGLLYILIGIWLTFAIFKEAHIAQASPFYFTLPVSPLERLLAIWICTSILFSIVYVVLGFLVGELAILSVSVMTPGEMHVLPLFSNDFGATIAFYTIVQPVFLYGAIRFGKNRLGKTWLWIAIFAFVFMVFNIFFCLTFNSGLRDLFADENAASIAFEKTNAEIAVLGKWLFGLALGPLMLIASYFRLTETQV